MLLLAAQSQNILKLVLPLFTLSWFQGLKYSPPCFVLESQSMLLSKIFFIPSCLLFYTIFLRHQQDIVNRNITIKYFWTIFKRNCLKWDKNTMHMCFAPFYLAHENKTSKTSWVGHLGHSIFIFCLVSEAVW